MAMDRLLRRFLGKNPDGLTDCELLELLLRFTNGDAERLAQRLVELYPSISALLEADSDCLRTVEGMDEDSLLLLRIVPELQRRYFLSHSQKECRLLNGTAFGRFLLPYFMGARDEMVYALLLDMGGNILNCRLLGHGSINSANVPVRRLVQEALTANASCVVLAHNHPSGLAVPSPEDIDLTLRIRENLRIMELDVIDHIIVADDDFISMKESGYLVED